MLEKFIFKRASEIKEKSFYFRASAENTGLTFIF